MTTTSTTRLSFFKTPHISVKSVHHTSRRRRHRRPQHGKQFSFLHKEFHFAPQSVRERVANEISTFDFARSTYSPPPPTLSSLCLSLMLNSPHRMRVSRYNDFFYVNNKINHFTIICFLLFKYKIRKKK